VHGQPQWACIGRPATEKLNMKIGPLDPRNLPTNAPADRRANGPVSPLPKGGIEPSAKVDLSSRAALRAEGLTEPTFDAAKVERIAAAIRDGSFKVNAEAIADKLIANAQELLGRAKN
jgi:negative regulator of flagellin synthesis FlgM